MTDNTVSNIVMVLSNYVAYKRGFINNREDDYEELEYFTIPSKELKTKLKEENNRLYLHYTKKHGNFKRDFLLCDIIKRYIQVENDNDLLEFKKLFHK
jgi:hypothetical protein